LISRATNAESRMVATIPGLRRFSEQVKYSFENNGLLDCCGILTEK